MIPTAYLFYGIVAILLLLLTWALLGSRKRAKVSNDLAGIAGAGCPHASYLPQMRWALSRGDFVYLSSRGRQDLANRLRKERRHVALKYLPAVRADFERMMRLTRVIASLSPQVATIQEWERLRLTLQFYWRYQLIRMGLLTGVTLIGELDTLSQMVSGLAVRMESAMSELGERAALAAKLASSLDGRGMDAP